MEPSSSSRMRSMPVPMEGLQEAGPSPFVTKTFEMVDDPSTNHIVSWNRGGISFVVWDPHSFSATILPYTLSTTTSPASSDNSTLM